MAKSGAKGDAGVAVEGTALVTVGVGMAVGVGVALGSSVAGDVGNAVGVGAAAVHPASKISTILSTMERAAIVFLILHLPARGCHVQAYTSKVGQTTRYGFVPSIAE